jgi:hypothetical protein
VISAIEKMPSTKEPYPPTSLLPGEDFGPKSDETENSKCLPAPEL